MSEHTTPPSTLPDRGQIDHLISLLTQVLEKKSDTDLTETIQTFVSSNERILEELQRIAESLDRAIQAVPGQDGINQRLDLIDRDMAAMNQNLERLLTEMLAPLDE